VKSFMRVISLLIGAFIVLGCQGSKDVSSSAPSSEAANAPTPTEETPPEPVQPEAAEPGSEGPDEGADLVTRVTGLTQMRTVEATDEGILITVPLEVSPAVDDKSPPRVVSDAMMFALFYTTRLLYGRTGDVDGLQMVFKYKAKTIGDIKTTRATFQSLGYDEATRGVTDQKAKRRVYRSLLAKLPKGAVKIDKKYRP